VFKWILLAGAEKIEAVVKSRDDMRVQLVEDYLKSIDTTDRIKMFIPDLEAIKNEGSRPIFEVRFSMEE